MVSSNWLLAFIVFLSSTSEIWERESLLSNFPASSTCTTSMPATRIIAIYSWIATIPIPSNRIVLISIQPSLFHYSLTNLLTSCPLNSYYIIFPAYPGLSSTRILFSLFLLNSQINSSAQSLLLLTSSNSSLIHRRPQAIFHHTFSST